MHLAGNMLFLWVFGRPIEAHVGPLRFLLLYL
ncbi:MAG: rhomboid family intramembrane serine protease, partial [bacterium]